MWTKKICPLLYFYLFFGFRKKRGQAGPCWLHVMLTEDNCCLLFVLQSTERLRGEHVKRVNLLRKQELKGVDYLKVEKNKREIESLESKMMVAAQSMEATTSEITRLRESELFPQLLLLVNGSVRSLSD